MANIFNKLQKLSPPSFVTTPTSNKRSVIKSWSNVVLKSHYKTLKDLLDAEITILTGYIERKGTQLRLEKALMLTKQIQKVALRWTSNDFYSQFIQFQKSIGNFDEKTGCLRREESRQNSARLPSTQWSNWIIYLALRDSALLAKINVECENTIKFWLGLIASAHHWGDSLVICGILARIWFLSSKLLDDFIKILYPTLLQVSSLLTPNKSHNWPDAEFKSPPNLLHWIQNTLNLSFIPIDPNKDFKPPSSKKGNKQAQDNLSFLTTFFIDRHGNFPENHAEEDEEKDDEFYETDDVQVIDLVESQIDNIIEAKKKKKVKPKRKAEVQTKNKEADNEDLGIIIERKDVRQKRKKKNCGNNDKVNTFKGAKAHWKKFFLNVPEKIKTEDGRRKLRNRISKYLKDENDARFQLKLKRLKKLVLKTSDSDADNADNETSAALIGFSKFQAFTDKQIKKLKKAKKNKSNVEDNVGMTI